MANIWKKDDSHREKPNRNVIDMSFQNNLTLDFGYLYPVVVQPTIPGDSYELKPTFALNFESMVFPIQTRMRSYLHFFKVRNRNLWKDWEDFIGKNKQGLEVPYIDESINKARTGKLLDYLGVPTTLVGNYGNTISLPSYDYESRGCYTIDSLKYDFGSIGNDVNDDVHVTVSSLLSWFPDNLNKPIEIGRTSSFSDSDSVVLPLSLSSLSIEKDYILNVKLSMLTTSGNKLTFNTIPDETVTQSSFVATYFSPSPRIDNTCDNYFRIIKVSSNVLSDYYVPSVSEDGRDLIFNFTVDSNSDYYIVFPHSIFYLYNYSDAITTSNKVYRELDLVNSYTPSIELSYTYNGVRDIDETNSPYWRSNDNRGKETIKLRALRPRAYEAIYNSFYRNAENNPYKINGVEEYNKYIPTDEGGLDSNKYELRRRNWEDDFLTTALPMPQAGIAPLVGLTVTAGAATVTIANSDGETVVANAQVDEDGNITSLTTDASSNLASSLLDTVTYGISINDLRNVNSFQRWLEAKARGGYKYRDQIETLFGVTVRYDTLDMPEFIGGMSLDVFVNQITQTVGVSPSSPLGDIAGQASCIGSGERITEYCDEHGYIIGILSVVPVPNYSQLLDKDWFKSDAFDYYFPQFGHIGMQPITYKEVCPVQAFQESTESDNVLEDTFGYQRAWYDYLARTDEVHGHFRTTLRDFVMNRTFDVKPELSESFLLVDNEQLNDVFAITDNSVPKIRGQIYFDMKGKRPIPLYGIPKLE